MSAYFLRILLRKQPVFTAFNFAGLVVGMTAALLLFKFVRYERTYDLQSPYANQVWRVYNETSDADQVITKDANTHSAVGPVLKRDVSDVLEFARLYCGNSPEAVALVRGQAFDISRFFLTDPGFLKMFPQHITAGDPGTCLSRPGAVILTQSTARRLFGTADVVGQNFKIRHGQITSVNDFTVTAVVNDPPENTHLKFDILGAYATRYAAGHQDNFSGYWDYNYFQLAPGKGPENVLRKLAEINESELKKEGIRLDIQRFTDIHLHSDLTYELEPNGNARMVGFLSLIAFLILGIAFINYVNLTTALAGERTREVGVRKAVGASRARLARQFLIENFLLTGSAFIASVICFYMVLPAFAGLVERNLVFDLMPAFWLPVTGYAALAALIAGLYPAAQLSGFKVVEALRGKFDGLRAEGLRKALVVVQIACSAGLIFGVSAVCGQLNFLKKHDLGVDLEQILTVKSAIGGHLPDSTSAMKMTAFKNECERLSGIRALTASSVLPGLGVNGVSGSNRPLRWTESPEYARITSYFVDTDEHFFDLFDIKILAGEYRYYPDRSARANNVTINRAMLDALGFPSPEAAIGRQIAYENSENGFTMTVTCVIDNFHIESLKNAPRPTIYRATTADQLEYLSFKIAPENILTALPAIQRLWTAIYPEQPFRYWFLDENFARQYHLETQFGLIFGLFAALAIFISCLGLLGLTAFNVRRRTKEIGVRKVLGASVAGITGLLTKDLLKTALLAVVLGSPPAWFLMEKWLDGFAYRINLEWWMVAGTGLVTLGIAVLTVSTLSIKAAMANPARSLKNE